MALGLRDSMGNTKSASLWYGQPDAYWGELTHTVVDDLRLSPEDSALLDALPALTMVCLTSTQNWLTPAPPFNL
jgi:hypothetical protein